MGSLSCSVPLLPSVLDPNPWQRLPAGLLLTLCEEAFHPISLSGVASQRPLLRWLPIEVGIQSGWGRGVAIWIGPRAQVPWGTGRADGGMFSRLDKGTFPKSRWKGVTRTPWALGGWPIGLSCRWQGRRGSLFPPLLWLPLQDAACPWHVTVE